jgi:chromosome partitioning protein
MKSIVIANTKGGNGKTTTVRTLGALLSESRRVLLVDLDPQASLTESCPLPESPTLTLADVLERQARLVDVICGVSERLHLAPGGQQLTATEHKLQASPSGQYALSRALSTVADRYEVALIDTPPTLSQLVINGLVAADGLILPCKPEANDLRALVNFVELLREIAEIPGTHLAIIGVVPTMFDARVISHLEGLEALQQAIGQKMLPAIGRSVRVSEAAAATQSITDYLPDHPRAQEYRELAKVVMKWLKDQDRS